MKDWANNKNRGFGIIEVLVSMSIMSLVIVTLFSLASTAFMNWDLAKNKAVAQGILQDIIESIHNKRDSNVLSGLAWDEGIDDNSFDKTVTVSGKSFTADTTVRIIGDSDLPPGAPNGARKEVSVVVSWTGRGSLGISEIKSITYITDWRPKY